MPEKSDFYRGKFVNYYEQKVSLTTNTPLPLTAALYKLYPFLIIWDSWLNFILWITDDTSLQIINLIIICISLRFLMFEKLERYNFESLVSYVLGAMATYFNWYSFAYHINSTIKQIREEEGSPSLEDINFILNKINDKLSMIRNDLLKIIGNKKFTIREFVSCVLVLTPFQFGLYYFNFIDSKNYIIWLFLSLSLYHSSWVQGTGCLLWRVILIRKLYYAVWKIQEKYITMDEYIVLKNSNTDDVVNIDLEELSNKHINSKEPFNLSREVRKLINSRQTENKFHNFKIIVKENVLNCKYEIIEVIIQQNERKWYPDQWKGELLSYERSLFSLFISRHILKSFNGKSLKEIEDSLPLSWDWLEDDWEYSDWRYFDTNWNYQGPHDSLNTYTRSRIIRRLLFCQIP